MYFLFSKNYHLVNHHVFEKWKPLMEMHYESIYILSDFFDLYILIGWTNKHITKKKKKHVCVSFPISA